MSTLEERLRSPGPKRILALDGGGVRGIVSLAILERIEAILRERAPPPGSGPFRLAHYFDLIGGTSTGSIIAAGLALGFSVDELFSFYRELSPRVFRRPFWNFGLFGPRFSRRPLAGALRDIIGDATLGSDRLLTGLAIVTKRVDSGSVWVLHNNPRGRYFARRREGSGVANGEIPLVSAILASTAAPTFFRPEFIKVNDSETGAFVDGLGTALWVAAGISLLAGIAAFVWTPRQAHAADGSLEEIDELEVLEHSIEAEVALVD